jgi:hypothetical protein
MEDTPGVQGCGTREGDERITMFERGGWRVRGGDGCESETWSLGITLSERLFPSSLRIFFP